MRKISYTNQEIVQIFFQGKKTPKEEQKTDRVYYYKFKRPQSEMKPAYITY